MDFQRARTAMVDCQVRPNSVTDFEIIQIMGEIPRENFVPADLRALAYLDEHLSLSANRMMLSPMRVAQMIQLADIQKTDVVLDVACGSGYSAAIMAGLASSVVAIDDDETLVATANEVLADLDIGNVAVMQSALNAGFAKEGPYDVIFVEGSVDFVSDELKQQLAMGGRIVCVEPLDGVDTAILYTKSEGGLSRREAFNASVPHLSPFTKQSEFTL
ncbi:protein-L-isoaspartate O-methyltransferase family protein [Maritalea sp.]|uniref:protein-L-isoaspartate O-methyltransferase family protein n=1 Tax=Maritalea sp. TaxID=2003361 RepID=UPI003EF0BA0C